MSFWAAIAGIGFEVVKTILKGVTDRMGESSNTEKILNVVTEIGEDKFSEGLKGLSIQVEPSNVKDYIADLSEEEAEELFKKIS
jgi:hypothetical protein